MRRAILLYVPRGNFSVLLSVTDSTIVQPVGCKKVVLKPDGLIMQPDGQAVKHKLAFICPLGLMADPGGLGQRILQARLNMAARLGRPVTQQEIAEQMKVHSVTVGRWEGAAKEPDLETIARLARVLGVDPRWLAFGEDQADDLNVHRFPFREVNPLTEGVDPPRTKDAKGK